MRVDVVKVFMRSILLDHFGASNLSIDTAKVRDAIPDCGGPFVQELREAIGTLGPAVRGREAPGPAWAAASS
jgi:hypothetical protein